MQGIDISGHQKGIDLSKVPCDFVIVKATQGTSYINPDFHRAVDQALSLGKCAGVYHYINGAGVNSELEHFLKIVDPYLGRVILCLDWEGEQNQKWGKHAYCMSMAQMLHERTGVVPFLYMSKSVCREFDWTPAAGYFLWCAQYANKKPTGYQESPWTDKKGWGAWKAPAIMQYASTGQLTGFAGNLDLDYTAITPDLWRQAAQPGGVVVVQHSQDAAQAVQEAPGAIINPPPYKTPSTPVKRGTKGNPVRWVQYMLNRHGYRLTVDGDFGIRTECAVVHFQWSHDLTIDGIVGPATRAALTTS